MRTNNTICLLTGLLLSLLVPGSIYAQEYMPAAKGCKVAFTVTNHREGEAMIRGTLSNLKGKIIFDPQHLNNAVFNITVSAGSASTGAAERDKTLKKDAYFNPAKYPLISIKSTSVTQDRPGGVIYVLHGNLTIKGVTKPVNIQFTATPSDSGYLFRGSCSISRFEFNVGTKDDGADDKVLIFIEVRANKK